MPSIQNSSDKLRLQIVNYKHLDEERCVTNLLNHLTLDQEQRDRIRQQAIGLVDQCRANNNSGDLLDAFLLEFGLSNQEGVALMCLAESLLRVPDNATADELIAEKITTGNWAKHIGQSPSLLVNASTWGLLLTGKIVALDDDLHKQPSNWFKRLTNKVGEPVVRQAVYKAMQIMGQQYVLGQTIEKALERSDGDRNTTRYSFDMLGEGARTLNDANRYFESYQHAIHCIGKYQQTIDNHSNNIVNTDNISIKLSALYPRYEYTQREQVMEHLLPKIIALTSLAKSYGISVSIDAEEADRLDLSLELFELLAHDKRLDDWNGLGIVVQAYQKRAFWVVQWLAELAKDSKRKLLVRLVKGAYWDSEIKHAQEFGLDDYSVFTRKENTDLSYEVCAQILFNNREYIYPQYATHNAYTLAYVSKLGEKDSQAFEYQRLHGMGNLLYSQFRQYSTQSNNLRIYAPVGKHEDLLPYLVRRLLENGANSSFVNRFLDAKVAPNELVKDTLTMVQQHEQHRHDKIPLPIDLYRSQNDLRDNSTGIDLSASNDIQPLLDSLASYQLPNDTIVHNDKYMVTALTAATNAQLQWNYRGATQRASILDAIGDNLEKHQIELISMISHEAGRTIDDCISEVREAVDFCRYYAQQARLHLNDEITMPSYTGELNQLSCHGKGVFLCISPWNFPLAIFMGQVVAALVTGNTVLAKPADQTPLIARAAIDICYESGVPKDVLQLIVGEGATIGRLLLSDDRVAGVAFTGSTQTAKIINLQLAQREGSIATLIAETGGQNCLIADSTSLPEQLVDDVIMSSFKSAGQRCSALRVLYLQDDIADKTISMLIGAMQLLNVGDPTLLSTDIGPIIDEMAASKLQAHIQRMKKEAKILYQTPLSSGLQDKHYIAPTLVAIDDIKQLHEEVFGPILHVIRYKVSDVDKVIDAINNTGFGLTLGVHSRIDSFANKVFQRTHVGNTYINRNTTGAVVGVNPFGGMGLSGTGPKAGGPHYLYRFINEKTYTENTVAKGGDVNLFTL